MKDRQRQKVLQLLKNAGAWGVSSYALTYAHSVKQAPTRIRELKDQGYNIISKRHGRTVTYVLSEASRVATQPDDPMTETTTYRQPWEIPMEKYFKDGRWFWKEKAV